jgi:hypothetical protein
MLLFRARLGFVKLRVLGAMSLLVVVVVSMTSCSGLDSDDRYLTLAAGEATLSGCPTQAPIMVEALNTKLMPTCDPIGQTLVFPDGEQIQLPEQQGGGGWSRSASESDFRYAYRSVGNWGLVAARVDGDCSSIQEWGNPEAIRRVHDAFGNEWACQ